MKQGKEYRKIKQGPKKFGGFKSWGQGGSGPGGSAPETCPQICGILTSFSFVFVCHRIKLKPELLLKPRHSILRE